MKLRSTTPVLNHTAGLAKKAVVIASAILMVGAGPMALMPHQAYADQYDSQMSAIQAQINQYQAQADVLSAQVNDLNAQLQLLEAQRNEILAQLQLTQAQYDKLTNEIQQTEQKISDNQNALGDILANMYVEGQTTPLEMLASSKNISDYIDQQSYQAGMSQQLKTTITKVQKLKADLQTQKDDVQKTLDVQKAQQNSLAAKEEQQNQLIAQTQGQEDAYRSLVSKSQQQLQSVAAQQRAYYQSLISSSGGGVSGVVGAFSYSNWSGNQGCSGGYPYCGAQDSMVDPWGLYNRECVSYVAWALANRFGKYVANFNGQGNAYQWPSSAPRFSGARIVQDPQPGDAVILPQNGNFAPIGHAMVVESVNGGRVHVSQYNFYGTGEYSTMDIGTGGVYFLRFPSK